MHFTKELKLTKRDWLHHCFCLHYSSWLRPLQFFRHHPRILNEQGDKIVSNFPCYSLLEVPSQILWMKHSPKAPDILTTEQKKLQTAKFADFESGFNLLNKLATMKVLHYSIASQKHFQSVA